MEKKHTVNEYLSLDVRKIRSIFRDPNAGMISTWTVTPGLFSDAETFASTLTLIGERLYVTNPFDGEQIPVTILPRLAYFGGWRNFFQCPFCSRVCEIIYFGPDVYGCRLCLELTYVSIQQAHKNERLIRFLFPDYPLRMAKKILRAFMKMRP